MGSEIRRRIAAAIGVTISLILNAAFLWPISHEWALAAGVLGLSTIAFAELSIRSWMFATAMISVGALAIYITALPIPPPDPWRGWLQPADETTPQNACGKRGEEWVTVLLGDNAFVASNAFLAQRGNRIVPLSICGRPAMFVEREPNGIRINATIHDKNGTSLGEIINNGYNIPKTDALFVEHSADLSALVVHNKSGDELLYLHYLNPSTLRVRGIFACERQPKDIVTVTNESISVLDFHRNCSENSAAGLVIP